MSDNPNECGVLGPESCWELNGNVWVYTSSHGNIKTGTLPGSEVTAQLVAISNTECLLQIFVNKVKSGEVNLFPLLEKIPPTTVDTGLDDDCVLTTTVDGVAATADLTPLLDKIVFPEIPPTTVDTGLDDDCVLTTTVDGVAATADLTPLLDKIPGTTVETTFNSETCDFTTTVDGVTSVTNIAEVLSSLCVEFDGQELVLSYKNDECRVTLPKHVVDVDINVAACTQVVTYSDGTVETQPYLDAVTLEKNAEGVGLLTVKGVTCPIHPPVDIPADVKITGINVVEGPDGTYNITVDVSDGTTLNAGPIIDTDTWTIVADNGNGTGTVTAPDGTNCTFVKGVPSTAVQNQDGTITVTQNDGTVVTNTPSTVTANPAGTGGGVGTATIIQSDGTVKDDAVCGVQSTAVENPDGTITVTQNDGTVVTNSLSEILFGPGETLPAGVVIEINGVSYGVGEPGGAVVPDNAVVIVDPSDNSAACIVKIDNIIDGNKGETVPLGAGGQTLADGTVIPEGGALPDGVVGHWDGDEFCIIKDSTKKSVQELFKAGDTLPDSMVGPIEVRLADGTFTSLSAGAVIPAGAGDVFVDEVTNEATCIVKSLPDPIKRCGLLPVQVIRATPAYIAGELLPGAPASDGSGSEWHSLAGFNYDYNGKTILNLVAELKDYTDVWPGGDSTTIFAGLGTGSNTAPADAPTGIFFPLSFGQIVGLASPVNYAIANSVTPFPTNLEPVHRYKICLDTNVADGVSLDIEGCKSEVIIRTEVFDVDNGSIVNSVSRPWDSATNVPPVIGQPTVSEQNTTLTWDRANYSESLVIDYTQGGTDGTAMRQQVLFREAVCVITDVAGNILKATGVCSGAIDPADFGTIEII